MKMAIFNIEKASYCKMINQYVFAVEIRNSTYLLLLLVRDAEKHASIAEAVS
jgi:hypothetical protein